MMDGLVDRWMDIILGHIDIYGSNSIALKYPVGKDYVKTVSKTSPENQMCCRDDQDEDDEAVEDTGHSICNLVYLPSKMSHPPNMTINGFVPTINNRGRALGLTTRTMNPLMQSC